MAIQGSEEATNTNVQMMDVERGDNGSADQQDGGRRRSTSRSNRNPGNKSNYSKDSSKRNTNTSTKSDNNGGNNGGNNNNSEEGLDTIRKNVDGLMDIALLSANANQLRFLLSYNSLSPTYIVSLVLVVISLSIQVGVGLLYIIRKKMINFLSIKFLQTDDVITGGIFLVTVVNVLAIAFTNTQTANAA